MALVTTHTDDSLSQVLQNWPPKDFIDPPESGIDQPQWRQWRQQGDISYVKCCNQTDCWRKRILCTWSDAHTLRSSKHITASANKSTRELWKFFKSRSLVSVACQQIQKQSCWRAVRLVIQSGTECISLTSSRSRLLELLQGLTAGSEE